MTTATAATANADAAGAATTANVVALATVDAAAGVTTAKRC